MIRADADEEVVTSEEIAQKYEVTEPIVLYWSTMKGFPEGWPSGPGRTLVRDAAEVDDWLQVNLPVHWAKGQDLENPYGLPEGGAKDLVSLADIAQWEAKALGRQEPVPTPTLRGYLSKKTMPQPDRLPGDGKRPEVLDRMWFRKTAYDWVNRPRRMRRQKKSDAQAEVAPAAGQPSKRPSGSGQAPRVDVDWIVATYGVSRPTAGSWSRTEGFPKEGDPADVDAWVRAERPRSWAAAQRRAGQGTQASAGVSADHQEEPAAAPAAKAKDGPDERVELALEEIGPRYGAPKHTGVSWTRVKVKREDGKVVRRAFPAPLRTGPRAWASAEVDAWVKEYRPHVWAAYTGAGPVLANPLPEGDPQDLLDIDDFAEIWGIATRGEPLARETVNSYHNRGQIPFADRTPDDGKTPRVLEYHWYRKTVYDVITSRRGRGNFEPRTPRA
ncbi:hypothetical protein OG369_41770 [Streptomyces sp. NBC_01221]|uniref:hypothetical protein n=1 Tax=Streptomyces sp. NBC_01221 TaxID=2903782 RepID=UPI00225232EB|nr:hypothetical protein [Streptomyces sp. NBC_01221]MCX4792020.1 hypothetical protein [Streptomyces sp. NBC_01221]MCX4792329.1 hypothetical protein [Streptomyces sp. NBC_01221]